MQLEQVKRKIPSVLFSWDTYSASREGWFEPLGFSERHTSFLKCLSQLGGFFSPLCSDEVRDVLQPVRGGGRKRQTDQRQLGSANQQAGEGPNGESVRSFQISTGWKFGRPNPSLTKPYFFLFD